MQGGIGANATQQGGALTFGTSLSLHPEAVELELEDMMYSARDEFAHMLGANEDDITATYELVRQTDARRRVQADPAVNMEIMFHVACGGGMSCADGQKKINEMTESHMANIITAVSQSACQRKIPAAHKCTPATLVRRSQSTRAVLVCVCFASTVNVM